MTLTVADLERRRFTHLIGCAYRIVLQQSNPSVGVSVCVDLGNGMTALRIAQETIDGGRVTSFIPLATVRTIEDVDRMLLVFRESATPQESTP